MAIDDPLTKREKALIDQAEPSLSKNPPGIDFNGVLNRFRDSIQIEIDGAVGGDMDTATYDPTGVADNAFDSANTAYDNTTSGLTATNVQDAIDEVAGGAPDASETVKGIAELATQAEVDAGTDDTRIVTPLKLASVAGGLGHGGGLVTQHSDVSDAGSGAIVTTAERNEFHTDHANRVALDAVAGTNTGDEPAATTTVPGVMELATQAEVDAGTDATRAVSPATLAGTPGVGHGTGLVTQHSDVSDAGSGAIVTTAERDEFHTDHANRAALDLVSGTNTGDEATATETTEVWVQIATQAEVDTGTDDVRYITPLKLAGSQLASDVSDNTAALTANRTELFPVHTRTGLNGEHPVNAVASNGSENFDFHIPVDFGSLVSLELVGIPDGSAAGAARDIDLISEYAGVGEGSATHTETDTTITYDLTGTSGQFTALDISSVFTSIAAGDVCGIHVDHNAIGGIIDYSHIRLVFTPA